MEEYQAGNTAPHDDADVGWQDSDSEGFVNDWEIQDAIAEFEQAYEQVETVGLEAALQQQPEPNPQQQATQDTLQGPAVVVQQQFQAQLAVTNELQPQQPEHQQLEQQQERPEQLQERPMHRPIAAFLHNRVVALLRQQLAATDGNQQRTTELDGDAALQLLHQAHQDAVAAGAGEADHGSSDEFATDSGETNSSDMQAYSTDEEASEGCTCYDPNVTASHTYLGDVDELEGTYGHLHPGTTARLPLLMLDGVVLFPDCRLPLLLSTQAEQHLLDRALAAQPPLTRLIAVMPGLRSGMVHRPRMVCCTAEIRQMRRQDTAGAVAVVALGRQRAEVLHERHMARSQSSVQVRILSEGCQSDVPQPIRCYESSIHPALAAPWDLGRLVNRVRELIQVVLMPVASFQGTPLELSYWVSHNLPLQPSTRQLLLTASGPAERLRMLLGLLERLDQLGCSSCGTVLATTADVLAMTSEGIAGTFVNSAGYVHEMVTFRRVHGIFLEGRPETAHSWFPGYAWTIAYCNTCGQHLGWRFTATQQHLSPRAFWGLRRPVLTCRTRPAAAAAHAGEVQAAEQQQQHDGPQGGGLIGTVVIPLGQLPGRVVEQEDEGDRD